MVPRGEGFSSARQQALTELAASVAAEEVVQEEIEGELVKVNRQLAELRADLTHLVSLAEGQPREADGHTEGALPRDGR